MSEAIEDDVHMISWKGNNKRILVYPVDYDRQFNVTCTYPSNLSSRQTSDNNSAAVIGIYLPELSPHLHYPELTLSPRSI